MNRKKPTIAIIDDNIEYGKFLKFLLQRHHYTVDGMYTHSDVKNISTFLNSDLAIVCYQSGNPVTLENIRYLKSHNLTRVIVSSLHDHKIPREDLKRIGVDGLYSKFNTDPKDILRLIEEAFQNKQDQ
jgi:DNA-binding response OmpR family regulator